MELIKACYYLVVGVGKACIPFVRTKSVENQIVLITGAGSGMGRCLAEKFALRHKAKVVCVDIVEDQNRETVDIIKGKNGFAEAFMCDVSDPDEVMKLASAVKANVGEVDILVNNAGVLYGKEFLESTVEMNRKTMAVNFEAQMWMVKAFLPSMMERNHGHLVTMSSVSGLAGIRKLVDYSASKYATIGFAESLAAEIVWAGKDGVKSTIVCSFFVSTGMFAGAKTAFPKLMPIHTPDRATDKILEAVLSNQEVLYMPRVIYPLVMAKAILPVQSLNSVMNCFGSHELMDTFYGREGDKSKNNSAAPNEDEKKNELKKEK